MHAALSLRPLILDSLARTRQLIAPSLPFAALFVGVTTLLFWGAGALPGGGAGFIVFVSLTGFWLFSHSLFSVSMYQAVLPPDRGMLSTAWKLSLAWLLIIVIAAIGATMIILFFSLIGASLGVVSGETGQEITDMTQQMHANGTFWPLFAIFILTLFGVFWFAVRMMLFAAATSARGTVHVFRTWFWTKGAFSTLAPAMVALVAVPVMGLSYIGLIITNAALGPPETSLETGFYAGLLMLISVPGAWLGHGFAAAAFAALAPEMRDQEITPA